MMSSQTTFPSIPAPSIVSKLEMGARVITYSLPNAEFEGWRPKTLANATLVCVCISESQITVHAVPPLPELPLSLDQRLSKGCPSIVQSTITMYARKSHFERLGINSARSIWYHPTWTRWGESDYHLLDQSGLRTGRRLSPAHAELVLQTSFSGTGAKGPKSMAAVTILHFALRFRSGNLED